MSSKTKTSAIPRVHFLTGKWDRGDYEPRRLRKIEEGEQRRREEHLAKRRLESIPRFSDDHISKSSRKASAYAARKQ